MSALYVSPRNRVLVCILLFILAVTFFWQQAPPSPNNTSYKPLKKKSRPNAAIFILLAPSRITQALVALQNIEDRFNRRLKYPIVLFMAENEMDYITEEVKAKASFITEGRVSFGRTL